MPKSRKTQQAVRQRRSGQPAWLLVLIGIIIGGAAMIWINFSGLMPISRVDQASSEKAQTEGNDNPQVTANHADERPTQQAPTEPRYDFYSVLPEKEVVIPDAEISAVAKSEKSAQSTADEIAPEKTTTGDAPQVDINKDVLAEGKQDKQDKTQSKDKPKKEPSKTASATQKSGYLLQVASVTSRSDADSLKAKLALQGLVANVQSVTIDGTKWYRVRLGPFASASELETTKKQLASAGIQAIALKAH